VISPNHSSRFFLLPDSGLAAILQRSPCVNRDDIYHLNAVLFRPTTTGGKRQNARQPFAIEDRKVANVIATVIGLDTLRIDLV